ncbi:enoyl-CoA hydratase/isomerase family protein [Conexibacter sp. CPCC 206217]|uniref:enoyl-CoA hydratase/isomerase family protein n=1 Tax=Conexibacter sp. CPCC 206217 TaxID=3064574 RepID=UPI00271E1E13|nr:enoyl-CoA hydratase/isomerase family protein [Conexibacter sp. CPCC 206217]MDO8212599.1 enoyl-CoA hydratase/isomerase family protein [Conexibacter sp. CPCC 206217]
MATAFESYEDKYENYRFERTDDGILTMTMHSEGRDLIWGMRPDDELGKAFVDIGNDPENQVIVLTGTGDTFIHHEDLGADFDALPAQTWGGYILPYVLRLIYNHIDIDAPMIAAVNGPATIHAEMALLCDVVLASDRSAFADQPHFPNGLVPGDGVQVIWPLLLGMNRARYLMYTGQVLSAQEAKDLGLVAELMPKEDLLPRAYEIAQGILEKPELTRRLTRRAFGAVWKDHLNNVLPYGAALEGLAAANYWPREFKGAVLPS